MKKLLLILTALALAFGGLACTNTDADVASENLSKEADQFRVLRRVVFYNGITGDYMLELIGFCSLGNFDEAGELSVTCKAEDGYKKHFLGLSDNVTYFAEQIEAENVSTQFYKVVFKPTTIVPAVELDLD